VPPVTSFTTTSFVKNGRLHPETARKVAAAIAALSGKWVTVTVAERKAKRSGKQNKYYWGVVLPLVTQAMRDAGNVVDEEEVHEFLKRDVGRLVKRITEPDGTVRFVTRSSAELSVDEWEKLMEIIRAWAAQFDIVVPLPNE
jgi:hypothetical protein